MFSLPQAIENSRQFLHLRFTFVRPSMSLKKYIKLIYPTQFFLCALQLINIPVA